jgi:hypothetical protein
MKDQLIKEGDHWKVLSGSDIEKTVITFLYKSWECDNTGYFPGPQPISIERRHFPILKKSEYVVCEKSDGVRHILVSLMYGDKKLCLLVNRAFSMFLVPINLPRSAYQGTILDGELVDKTFLVYDAVLVNGKDVKQCNLITRMKTAEIIINGILKLKTDPVLIKQKTFYNLKNFGTFLNEFQKMENTDGIIITPVNEPIRTGTHETMFKWKPQEKNTIDFQVKPWGNSWGLFVQEKGRFIFESELLLSQAPEWITENCIVECMYMTGENPKWWKPLNIRVDKKHPNNRKTFYRTLVNINENIQLREFHLTKP